MKYFILFYFLIPSWLFAQICLQWSEPKTVGILDHKVLGEASGIAVSKLNNNRLYHINDSGDGPFFYLTSLDGKNTSKITIQNFNPMDVEDLAYGKVGDDLSLIIGDVGDNFEIRPMVSFVIIKEVESFSTNISASKILLATYPDRPHNAEGIALHPSGDLFVVTKEGKGGFNSPMIPQIAKIFKISKENLIGKNNNIEMEPWGEIDLPKLLQMSKHPWGKIVTSFDISPDGKKILLLTYDQMVEFDYDLSKGPLQGQVPFIATFTQNQTQQEAITYFNNGKAVLYNSEYKKRSGEQKLISSFCL